MIYTQMQHPTGKYVKWQVHVDGLVEDCSISIANALEIMQSCTKPSLYTVYNSNYHVSTLIKLFQ